MSEQKKQWHKIADSIHELYWQENNMLIVEVDGKHITLARQGEQVFACAYKCPHASGILADGFIDAVGNIVCPLHRYKFSLKNGRNVTGEGYYLKTYEIRSDETGIYIGFDKKGLFNWL